MGEILVRGLDRKVVDRLKARAKRHGRSLQSEAKTILQSAAALAPEEVGDMLDRWRKKFAGRRFDDSAALIREDRER
jgi:plasmid stability protein